MSKFKVVMVVRFIENSFRYIWLHIMGKSVATCEQIRVARAFLRVSVVETSKLSGIGVATI